MQPGTEADIERAAQVIAGLSMDELPIAMRKAGITQAVIDEIADRVRSKARIAGLDLDKLIDNFVNRFTSERTRYNYQLGISHWVAWCKQEGIHPLEATGDHADAYAGALRSTELKPATMNLRINAASSFYSHLVKRGHLSATPFIAVRRAQRDYEARTVATADQLLEAVQSEPEPVQLAVRVMLATGVRVGAFATFSTSARGAWQAASKGSMHAGTLTDKALITAVRGGHTSLYWKNTNLLTVRIKRAFARAGIEGGAHQCRHRFALNLYQASGNNVEAVRRALGHRDIGVTTAYLQGLQEK